MSLFTRQINQSHSSDLLIAPHPQLKILRAGHWYFPSTMVLTFIFFVISIASHLEAQFSWVCIPLFILLSVFYGISLVKEWYLKPLEVLRPSAALGDDHLLADEQPRPNAEALLIPMRITTRISRIRIFVFDLLLILGFPILLAAIGWPDSLVNFSIWLSLAAAVLAIAIVFPIQCYIRNVVEVDQEGIRSWVKDLGTSKTAHPILHWHEARLFAWYRKPGPWNKRVTLTYELSSATHVIQWTWVQRKGAFEEPTIPFEEYQAQMRALCSLIMAKTGLPLYDLSSERALKRAQAMKDEKRARK